MYLFIFIFFFFILIFLKYFLNIFFPPFYWKMDDIMDFKLLSKKY